MTLKKKFGIFCMLVVFFNLSATQYVEHTKTDLMPSYKDGRISLTYQDADNNEMGDEEIWYSKTSDDSEGTCNSSDTTIGDDEIKAIEVKAALEEEKKRLSSDAKIQNMLKSIVDVKPMPKLQTQPQNRLKIWKRYDTCPEKRYTLHYYWESPFKRICKVIQPWIQPVTYAICLTKSCCQKTFNAFVFTRCLPCGWTRHRFVVVCYNIKPPHNFQWKVVTRWFPQACDCHNYVWTPFLQQAQNNLVKG